MRAPLAALVLLVATRAFAFAPAQVVHEMVGRMLAVGFGDAVVSMKVDCVFYEEGPTCTGSWRCKTAAGDPPNPICGRAKGRAVLEMDALARDDHLSHDAKLSVRFSDATECSFRGTVPFSFGQVPAVSGTYECLDTAGAAIEQGLFGFRARSIGKPFHRFD